MIEVVQANRSRDTVQDLGVRIAQRDDIGQVQADEVDLGPYIPFRGISDFYEDKEHDGDEEEEGGEQCPEESRTGRSFDDGLGRFIVGEGLFGRVVRVVAVVPPIVGRRDASVVAGPAAEHVVRRGAIPFLCSSPPVWPMRWAQWEVRRRRLAAEMGV